MSYAEAEALFTPIVRGIAGRLEQDAQRPTDLAAVHG
jgi:hypothetical protein